MEAVLRHVQDKEINWKGTAVIKKSLEETYSSSLEGSFCPSKQPLQISALWGGCSRAGPCLQAILFEYSMLAWVAIYISGHYPWISVQEPFFPQTKREISLLGSDTLVFVCFPYFGAARLRTVKRERTSKGWTGWSLDFTRIVWFFYWKD